jgi:hypothetical protein
MLLHFIKMDDPAPIARMNDGTWRQLHGRAMEEYRGFVSIFHAVVSSKRGSASQIAFCC